jgi:putative two-component system hydrogenase maturation factor HypX/HoxX
MKILFLTHSFNSLAQRLFVELADRGHEVAVELDIHDDVTREALDRFAPDLVLAPFLKRAIPEDVWRRVPCLIVHPGIPGDRGPSSLDWCLITGESTWGVTLLQANAEMDAGDIWATAAFAVRETSKSDLYRREVTEAATAVVLDALDRWARGTLVPQPLDYSRSDVRGRARPPMRQADRAIDWQRDDTVTVLRKLRAADSSPGVLDRIGERPWYLFGPHREGTLRGEPGAILAQRHGAICRATVDGAVWISHLKGTEPLSLKLPAAMALGDALSGVPERAIAWDDPDVLTFRDIRYEEQHDVGYLHFDFYNGAMGTEQCQRLLAAYRFALTRPTKVLVLMGGRAFWSNGIHLHLIEAADSPADEAWANINAMDDLAEAIIRTDCRLTMAAVRGNAGAGGVFLALAADQIVARDGIVLNPHYKGMGNLYGSEYWTYLLPRRVGEAMARTITDLKLPVSVGRARHLGLLDAVVGGDDKAVNQQIVALAEALAQDAGYAALLASKQAARRHDEAIKPLAAYRQEELAEMRLSFYGFDPSFHVARYNFVHRVPHSRTPIAIAPHRRLTPIVGGGGG